MSYRTPRSEIENRATRELTYETKFDLTGIHEKRITGVAISPEGRYVATCSEDCSITLWLVRTGEATHRIVARSAVLCATWPSDPATLICGTADGTLLTIAISSVCQTFALDHLAHRRIQPHLVVSGFDAHSKPIEHLVVNEVSSPSSIYPGTISGAQLGARRRLASAGHDEIKVWLQHSEGQL